MARTPCLVLSLGHQRSWTRVSVSRVLRCSVGTVILALVKRRGMLANPQNLDIAAGRGRGYAFPPEALQFNQTQVSPPGFAYVDSTP